MLLEKLPDIVSDLREHPAPILAAMGTAIHQVSFTDNLMLVPVTGSASNYIFPLHLITLHVCCMSSLYSVITHGVACPVADDWRAAVNPAKKYFAVNSSWITYACLMYPTAPY